MTDTNNATRRKFFVKAGTALSLPLAAAASAAEPLTAGGVPTGPRDAVTPVRQLKQALARELNAARESNGGSSAAELFTAGKLPAALAGVTRLLPTDFGESDALEIAADGLTAAAAFYYAVETSVPIAAEGTLIEMARAQGEGFVRTTVYRTLDLVCVCERGTWKIEALAIRESSGPALGPTTSQSIPT